MCCNLWGRATMTTNSLPIVLLSFHSWVLNYSYYFIHRIWLIEETFNFSAQCRVNVSELANSCGPDSWRSLTHVTGLKLAVPVFAWSRAVRTASQQTDLTFYVNFPALICSLFQYNWRKNAFEVLMAAKEFPWNLFPRNDRPKVLAWRVPKVRQLVRTRV